VAAILFTLSIPVVCCWAACETVRDKAVSSKKLAQFIGERYLNLESYRKSGQPVVTPVWFAQEGGTFFIYSLADAGKVKRVRSNPRVRIQSCDMRGKPKGEWVEAAARIADAAATARGHQLLNQKYWLKRVGDIFSKLRRRKRAVITIHTDQAGGARLA
jgi:PPOX class probable F420-dependent enzyme